MHELEGIVRDREDVGWSLHTLLASVGIDTLLVVHWEPLVGVYSGTEQPRVGLKDIVEGLSIQWTDVTSLKNLIIFICVILRRSSMLHNAL